jgi:hypothetical protein
MILPETMVVVEVFFVGTVMGTDPSEVESVLLGGTEGESLTGMFQGILIEVILFQAGKRLEELLLLGMGRLSVDSPYCIGSPRPHVDVCAMRPISKMILRKLRTHRAAPLNVAFRAVSNHVAAGIGHCMFHTTEREGDAVSCGLSKKIDLLPYLMRPIVRMCSEMRSKIMGSRERKWTAGTGMRFVGIDASGASGAGGALSFRIAHYEDWRGTVVAVIHQLHA